ncbi:16326_t:CDS:2 [Gigaspora margarita]|uniref:16326_t:CDS:1 n=1 Tax=Gigaspora margarita TaxID=4874 RepID=A0ABN7UV56_GIGMA|nr:16326_t:CDS:2 [Gigaspora margarita]
MSLPEPRVTGEYSKYMCEQEACDVDDYFKTQQGIKPFLQPEMETESSPSVFLSEMASSPSVVPSENGIITITIGLSVNSETLVYFDPLYNNYSQNHFTIYAFVMTTEELKVVIDIKLTEELSSMHERNPAIWNSALENYIDYCSQEIWGQV